MICKEWPHLSVFVYGSALAAALIYVNYKPDPPETEKLVPDIKFPSLGSFTTTDDIGIGTRAYETI